MPGSLQTQHLGLSLFSPAPQTGNFSHHCKRFLSWSSSPGRLAGAQWGLPEAGKWQQGIYNWAFRKFCQENRAP